MKMLLNWITEIDQDELLLDGLTNEIILFYGVYCCWSIGDSDN